MDLNGLWNLVLTYQECNRGEQNRNFTRVPHGSLLERLYKGNEYLFKSNQPFKETTIMKIEKNSKLRGGFLKTTFNYAFANKSSRWIPEQYYDIEF